MPKATAPPRVQLLRHRNHEEHISAPLNDVSRIEQTYSTPQNVKCVEERKYLQFTKSFHTQEHRKTSLCSRSTKMIEEDMKTSGSDSDSGTVVGDDNVYENLVGSSTNTVVDPTEHPHFRLPERLWFADSWDSILPYLSHSTADRVTTLVISIQDSIPLRVNSILLPSCTKLQLRTRHPLDLSKFSLPKLTSLVLLACDIRETSSIEETMMRIQQWTTKPKKLFLGLKLNFNEWKMFLRILGEFADSVQVAVPRNCPEEGMLRSFLNPTDELGNRQLTEVLPFVNTIPFHVIDGPNEYSIPKRQGAKETLGIPTEE